MSRTTGVVCLVAAIGAGVLLAAGCTGSSAGTPRPAGGTSTSAGGQSSETSSPARPRELRLDGKDPCALIPQADHSRYFIERPGVQRVAEPRKSPECMYSTDVGVFSVELAVTEGIEKWTDGSRAAEANRVAPVVGFPSISITSSTVKQGCFVAVDVADGQYVMAAVILIASKESQVPEKCEYAHQLAESAMKTLVSA